jgi:hypothetical protein
VGGTKNKMSLKMVILNKKIFKVISMIIAIIVLIIISGIIGYRIGNDNNGKQFKLSERVQIESENNAVKTYLPAGTILYGVRDPYGEKTKIFKVYLMARTGDPIPIVPIKATNSLATHWIGDPGTN